MGMINHQAGLPQNATGNAEVMLALHEIGVGSINQVLLPQNTSSSRDVNLSSKPKPSVAHDCSGPQSIPNGCHNGTSILECNNTVNLFPTVSVSGNNIGRAASASSIQQQTPNQVKSGPQGSEDEYKTQLSTALASRKDGACRNGKLRVGRWTSDEKVLFLYGLRKFGKGRWKKISLYVPGR
jgi:hypothetical protein